ncbi:MAG: sigma 54-interacting transcriptional regulator [Bryobacteraceae bacterium]
MKADLLQARYDALLEVSESIASHQSLPTLFHVLVPSLAKIMSFDALGLDLYDPERRLIRLYVSESPGAHAIPMEREFPAEQTATWLALQTRRPVYVPDTESETRFPPVKAMLAEIGSRSYCVFPLCTEQRQLGGLAFSSARTNAYGDDEISFMGQVARQVAIAVENTLNYEAATKLQQELACERDHLRLLLQVNNAIVAHLNTGSLFHAISGSLRHSLDVEVASLTLWDSESNQLCQYALDLEGSYNVHKQGPPVSTEDTPPGIAFTTRKPVIMKGHDLEHPSYPFGHYLLGQGYRLVCSVPLISGDRVLGTLNVGSRREEIEPDDVSLLVEVGGQIAIALDNAAAYRRVEELSARLAEERLYLKEEIRANYFFEEIVGKSAAISAVLQQVETVAPSDSNVLICGETGTGKELVARAIHNLSPRHQNAFAKVNCAAIPTGLLESELFGHERGAFTGAIAQRMGRFELAHRGTIFLDEIGDVPLELQPKLLRVLQEREFERLGSGKTIRVDVRIVAATNQDLLQMVEEKKFRPDLYYRLNVFPIVVPPLRERKEDIPLLVSYFVQQFASRMGKEITRIPSEAMEYLVSYPWPGNIRELQNLVERAVILSSGPALKIPLEVLRAKRELPHGGDTLEDVEREHILKVLEETNWVLSGPNGAAAKLGLKRPTLQFHMKKLGISRPH